MVGATSTRDRTLPTTRRSSSDKKGKLWRTLTNLLKSVRFSPDSTKIFGETTIFEVGELDLTTNTIRGARRAGSWTTSASYLNNDWLVVGGSSELRVFPLLANETPITIGGRLRTIEAVSVSKDKRMFCATDRGATLACFSKDVFEPGGIGVSCVLGHAAGGPVVRSVLSHSLIPSLGE
jgi:hypothetical protein